MLKDTLYNLLDYKSAIDLGRESLRGRHHTFNEGGYPYGSIPYGYNRLYTYGDQRREVPRHERSKNLRNWIQNLAVVPAEAEIVKRIYGLYLDEDRSLCEIAQRLNAQGVQGPGRGRDAVWSVQNVRRCLRCPVYVRISRIGEPINKTRHAHNNLDPEQRLGDWPEIVGRDTWDRAQEKLDGNNGHPHAGRSGALQGILYCGTCGYVLHKQNPRKTGDPRGDQYRCASVCRGLPVRCRRWTCYEADVMPVVAAALVKAVDEETLALLQAGPEEPAKITNHEVLQAHLIGLKERLTEATDQMFQPGTKPAVKGALEKRIEALDQDVTETRRRIAALAVAENQGGLERFLEWWQEAKKQLVFIAAEGGQDGFTVADVKYKKGDLVPSVKRVKPPAQPGKTPPEMPGVVADPGKLRAMLKRLNAEVRVFWRQPTQQEREERKGQGNRGRRPEWLIDQGELKVEINCGSSDDRSAWAGRRAPWGRAGSRRRPSRAP